MISENQGRLPMYYGYDVDDIFDDIDDLLFNYYEGEGDRDYDDIDSDTNDYSERRFAHGGRAPRGFSRDEAEETRYFTVLVNSYGTAVGINTDRIYAVDEDQAATLAEAIVASGRTKGFVGDYRYAAIDESGYTRVTFLDCGRSLDNFREFLKASILMSLIGLLVVFAVICYFAGRIVRPVAESYEKQKRFITDAGHEIKTPLAIIKANIDVMRMDLEDIGEAVSNDEIDPADETAAEPLENVRELTGSLNESLSDIDGQVDRLTTLTSDLVYLSRMEEGDNKPTMYQTDAKEFFNEVSAKYQGKPNVIYEICNEPNGDADWENDVKGYAEDVIGAIRDNSRQLFAIVAIFPILFYNGKLGKRLPKWFGYVFYPAHLLAIAIIAFTTNIA